MIAAPYQSALLSLADELEEVPPTPTKEQVDAMTYKEMLRKVRCAPLSDPLFRGEVGKHFHATLKIKRHDTPAKERTVISKRV